MDPQAELSWQLPVPGKEQKVSRVLPSDLLNSENQAKFRLVKATLHIPFSFLFVFYRHMCGENGASFFFFFFSRFHTISLTNRTCGGGRITRNGPGCFTEDAGQADNYDTQSAPVSKGT